MAGMLAARVLAEVHDEVVVVDRDELSGVDAARRGVPQGRHAHGLLARGQQILEDLFPGFTAELEAAGIPVGDLGGQVRWYFDGHRLSPGPTDLRLVGVARPVLEGHVRRRVAALPGVRFVEGADIAGLTVSGDGGRVTGARVHHEGREQALEADLVVDATGRGSRAPVWLEELGYGRVPEERIRIDLTYTSVMYRWRTDPFRGDMSINPVATPANPRGAFLHTLGGDRCMLSLTGVLGDRPPTDPEGLMAYAKSLPVPDVAEALQDAEMLGTPVSFRFPASQRRRFEQLPRLPRGFLVAGDAVCSFNPVYGQGMAVAALQAVTLRRHLLRGGDPDPRAYFADVAGVVDVPWEIAAGGDFAFPQVEGRRTLRVRMGNAYLARLHVAARSDAVLTERFLRVAGLVDPPQALMAPATALRVLRGSRARAA